MELGHVLLVRHAHGELERHGEDPSVAVCLETTGRYHAGRFDHRPGNENTVPPVAPLRLDPYPFRSRQVLEINDRDAEFPAQLVYPLLFHHVCGVRRPAPFAERDALRAHRLKMEHQAGQGVVVRRARKWVRRVEVRLKQHILARDRIDLQKVDGPPDARCPVAGLDERHSCLIALPSRVNRFCHSAPLSGFPAHDRDCPCRNGYQEFTPVHHSS